MRIDNQVRDNDNGEGIGVGSGVGLVITITIEGVRALATPHFDFRVSGESSCRVVNCQGKIKDKAQQSSEISCSTDKCQVWLV